MFFYAGSKENNLKGQIQESWGSIVVNKHSLLNVSDTFLMAWNF